MLKSIVSQCNASHCRATSPCGKQLPLESPRPQAQTAGLHSTPVRRVPPWLAYPCGTQTRVGSRRNTFLARTNGQAGGLRFLFVLFLFVQEKNTFLLCQGERYVLFSLRRKAPKDSPRLPSRTLNLLLGSIYPRLPTVVCSRFARQADIRRAGIKCRWKVCARRRKARAA